MSLFQYKPTALALVALAGVSAAACSDNTAPVVAPPTADAGTDTADPIDTAAPSCAFDIDCEGALCIDGTCQAARCQPGVRSCRFGDIVTCNADADGFDFVEACPNGTVCGRDTCIETTCAPDTRTCTADGRAVAVCNSVGTGTENRPCLGEQVCFEGQCDDAVCSPGKTLCLDDLTLGTCDDNGGGYRGSLCGFARRCVGAGCVPHHAIDLGAQDPTASAAAPMRRPERGHLALWVVLDAVPDTTVELFAWTSPLHVGLRAAYDPEASAIVLSTSPDDPAPTTLPWSVPQGDVQHLLLSWTADTIDLKVDGYSLPPSPVDVTVPQGTPTDSLVLGRFSDDGAAWPGRVGAVWVGAQASVEDGYVPRCDEHVLLDLVAAWNLDDGMGDTANPDTPDTPPMTLRGAAWSGGLLGRYARDADDDGYGYDIEAVFSCGKINEDDRLRLGDCNDGNPVVYPGAPELDDRIDNDCDDITDEQ